MIHYTSDFLLKQQKKAVAQPLKGFCNSHFPCNIRHYLNGGKSRQGFLPCLFEFAEVGAGDIRTESFRCIRI